MTDLHAAIMNLKPPKGIAFDYQTGFQDARHAAAELVSAALSAPPGPMVPAGWFKSPHGAFRANPLYQLRFPSQLLKWQIPLYCLLPVSAAPSPQEQT